MNELIEKEYKNKIIEIGEIEEVTVNANNKSNKIVLFGSDFLIKILILWLKF